MMNEFTLKVRDIFESEHFKHAFVAAGAVGLDKVIRWVHVLEVKEFDSLIHGGELILTTGVGLHLGSSQQLEFFSRLIDSGTVGICIEKGEYIQEIHPDVLALADERDFPIILFDETVKFVDITQELHSLIINRHHGLLQYLDVSSRKFIELSMSSNGILKILQELHAYFHQPVIFIPIRGKSYFFPAGQKDLFDMVHDYFQSTKSEDLAQRAVTIREENFILMPVKGLGQTWGYIYLRSGQGASEEFHYLILDRAALSIAQILLRNRTIEERKQHSEDKLVRSLLLGREQDLTEIASQLGFSGADKSYRVFVMEIDPGQGLPNEEDWENMRLQRTILVRDAFKRFGLSPAISATQEEVAVIAAFPADAAGKVKESLGSLVAHFSFAKEKNLLNDASPIFGIGRDYSHINRLSTSYQEACKLISLKRKGTLEEVNFYEDTGIYRILFALKKEAELDTFIGDYLGKLLSYDAEHESELYETLKVYLECGGAKKEAAERLFIVRQTLYHRLDKIEQLLGNDFMSSSTRLAIETAIKAYEMKL